MTYFEYQTLKGIPPYSLRPATVAEVKEFEALLADMLLSGTEMEHITLERESHK